MAKLKFKNSNGEWESIAAFQGEPGKDGAIQYTAGEGIKIEDNVISSTGGENGNGLKGVYVVDAPQFVITGASYGNRETYPEMFTNFENTINKAIADGYKYPILIVNAKNATYLLECKQMYVGSNNSITFTSPLNTNNENQIGLTSYTINYKIGFYGTWTDNIYTLTSISTYKGEMKIIRTTEVLTRDNTSSFTPTKDYHPATKKYVDDNVESVPYIYIANNVYHSVFTETKAGSYWFNADPNFGTRINELCTKYKDKVLKEFYMYPEEDNIISTGTYKPSFVHFKMYAEVVPTKMSDNKSVRYIAYLPSNTDPSKILKYTLKATFSYDANGVFNGSFSSNVSVTIDKLLKPTNTEAYTPTSDYNPATKKYVDDSIKTAITDALGGSY